MTNRRKRKKSKLTLVGLIIGFIAAYLSYKNDGIAIFPTNTPQPVTSSTTDRVVDGDTIKLGDKKIRLLGVNTPEMSWGGKPEECFAKEAKAYLETLVATGKLRLEKDAVADEIDKYGRELAYLYSGDVLVNAALISEGYGFAYRRFKFSRKPTFIALEEEAKAQQKGLWKACDVKCSKSSCKAYFLPP